MLINDYWKPIYAAMSESVYYPSRKGQGLFVALCLYATGVNYYNYVRGIKYDSKSFETAKKRFSLGQFSNAEQDALKNINIQGLSDFYESSIDDEKVIEIALNFGIPKSSTYNKKCFCMALALQFNLFITSTELDVEDIVASEYRRLIEDETPKISVNKPLTPYYPNDSVYDVEQTREHCVSCYRKFKHFWKITNGGKQTWNGRKLVFTNSADIHPRAEQNEIDIPCTSPNHSVELSVEFDARGYECSQRCCWKMVDCEGNDCFPNNENQFSFDIKVDFE